MNFGEKKTEYSAKHGGEIPVWQSPKYLESKTKAIEIINSGKYNVGAADFWILMNVTKNGKMAYTGLIISHNGCLKINDQLESKFDPSCVSVDTCGYRDSLVYSYCNPDQGIYEVGEVSAGNCKNEYPYAMAFKRLFDRVVLKLSKLAYAGIYSDSEADEFVQRLDANDPGKTDGKTPQKEPPILCEACGVQIVDTKLKDGSTWDSKQIANYSINRFQRTICPSCQKKAMKEESA